MNELSLNIDDLIGSKVVDIHKLKAEVPRTAGQYAIIECEDKRVMIAFAETPDPCPNPRTVLEMGIETGGHAFTAKEALDRLDNKPIGSGYVRKSERLVEEDSKDEGRTAEQEPTAESTDIR